MGYKPGDTKAFMEEYGDYYARAKVAYSWDANPYVWLYGIRIVDKEEYAV
jgi:hypothetical protein